MGSPAIDSSKREAFIIKQLRDQLMLGRTLQEAKLRFLELFDETEIDRAIESFKAQDERFKSAREVSTLHDEPNYSGWYEGPDESSTSVWSGLKRTLKSKLWSDLMIENLDISSTGVIEQIAPPQSEKMIKIKGLVLGYVQSGKTANYSAVTAKAVDAGYKLIIILSGMHNNLRKQTQARLKMELVDPNPTHCTTLTVEDEKGDFKKKQPVAASRALSVGGFTLVVLKKNSAVLRNFHTWLDGASGDVIQKTPTLVIDDESDQASINTSKLEEDPTAINKHIRKLMARFHVCTYVGYTATPFANVLVDVHEDHDVFPRDFLISLGKPPNYFGAEELFGREKVGALTQREGAPVIRAIPPEDAARLAPKAIAESHDSQRSGSLLTGSIETAIDSFILGSAARYVRGQHKKHMTMLLHVSYLTDIQALLKADVDEHLKLLKFKVEDEDPTLYERLKKLWEDDFLVVSKEFDGSEIIPFEKIWKYSKTVVQEMDSILENSKSLERLSFEGVDPIRAIVIGGNTLSRGLTLEGLTVSYFVRTSLAYDTLLQMGRWFGYRPGYIDLTRIFVTEDLRDYFYHLATVEQEIRDEIKMMAANGERPIDVGLRIRNHPHLTVTASNKMRKAQDCAFTYSGTKIQARHIITQTKEAVDNNYIAVKELYSRCKNFGKSEESSLNDFKNAHLFRHMSQEVVLQFLDDYLFAPENGRFTSELLGEYISKQNEVNEVTDWSVAFLSSQKGPPVDLGGVVVNAYDRSILRRVFEESGTGSVQLRALSTPGEELIDLGDQFEGNISRVEDILQEGRERESEIALRRRYRPPERGLLLIHPLNWKQTFATGKTFALSIPLTARGPVFGITFVFPYSKQDQSKYGFVSNRSITGPRLVPGIEIKQTPVVPAPTRKEKSDPNPSDFLRDKEWKLSKSQFVKGRKCLKRVWLYNHSRELAAAPSEMQVHLFQQGNEVGILAQKYFEGGHLIQEDYRDPDGALAHTLTALQDPGSKVLFEAAFLFDGVLIRVDVFRKNEDGSFDLIEVKSTNSVKKEHKDDIAVQKFVIESLGYKIRQSYLMHLNSQYELNGTLDLKKLFVLEPMEEEIESLIEEVPNYLKLIRSKLNEQHEPLSPIGSVCKSPYRCEFKDHCWKDVGPDSIHTLTRISEKKRAELVDLGLTSLKDIPDSVSLTETQAIQVRAIKTGTTQIDREQIKTYLKTLEWPLHFLDYETISFAIPRHSQSSPYQQLPFQFSLHVQNEPNGTLQHYEFLHNEDTDPRKSFIENLLEHIDGDRGSIVVYHAGFETNVTKALKQIMPELADAFDELTSRMWDLEVPFAKRWYCDARFEGSSSIKYVLPALVPGLSYKDLEIQKGDAAQKKYGELIALPHNQERERLTRALLDYCKMDTLAMVKILEKLLDISGCT